MKPEVSVVLPTRDRAYCLERAVASVAAQDFNNWELILVDDGSKDSTPMLRRGFADMLGPRFVDLETGGKGASAARNAGIAAARGEYIAFLDSDDLWLPEKLGIQLEAMQRCQGAGMCFTDFTGFDDAGAVFLTGHSISPELDGNAYPALLYVEHNCVTTPSVMVRRTVLDRAGGFDESMRLCEDIDLWTRIARIAPVIPIRIPLVLVHFRPTKEFPYEPSIIWRAALYNRAARRDPSLRWATLAHLHRGLLQCYHGAATGRGDRHQESVLAEAIQRMDRYASMSPQELEALFLECAARCGSAAGT
jgi:glycosyltransferase involved in cell wall biosynthesis